MKSKLLVALLFLTSFSFAQSFNEDKTAFSNFLRRMYTASAFEGVKIVDDYNHQYLVSVISLEKAKYNNESIMNRVAQVKAQSQANTFLNGASIDMNLIVTTTEKKDSIGNKQSVTETIETIKQNASGFTQGLELLSNFDNSDSKKMVFIFYRELKK
jgi:hypothetical protein